MSDMIGEWEWSESNYLEKRKEHSRYRKALERVVEDLRRCNDEDSQFPGDCAKFHASKDVWCAYCIAAEALR